MAGVGGCSLMPTTPLPPAEEAAPLPSGKPVLAVLPFGNMSGNPDQAGFADGITKELFTKLTAGPAFSVISQNSTSFYGGGELDMEQVGQELGADYLVAGGTRKVGDSVWITVRLIDAETGDDIWEMTDECGLKDIASFQEEMSLQIAIACMNDALAVNPNNMQLYSALAYSYHALSAIQQDEQSRLLDKAFETAAECLNVSFDESSADCVGAMLTVSPAIGYRKTISYLEEIQSGNPDRIWPYLLLSDLHGYMVSAEDAIAAAEEALKRDPDSVYGHWRMSFGHLQAWGTVMEPGAKEKALEMAKKCVTLGENVYWCQRALGHAYLANDLLDQAIAAAQTAISIDPNEISGYTLLVDAYLAADRYGDTPDTVLALWGMGGIYSDMGRYGDAIAAYQYISTLEPDLPGTYANLANAYLSLWTLLGTYDPQVLDRATEMAQKAISLDQSNVSARATLAGVHLWKREYGQAAVEARKAIGMDPDDGNGYSCMARILNATGKPVEAIEMADMMRKTDPDGGFIELGEAYHGMGRYEEAIDAYKQALARDTDYETSFRSHVSLAILYSELGRSRDAESEAAEVLKLFPDFSVGVWGGRAVYQDQASLQHNMALLRKAGLK